MGARVEWDVRPLLACRVFAAENQGGLRPCLEGVRCYRADGALVWVATDTKALLAVRLECEAMRAASPVTIPACAIDSLDAESRERAALDVAETREGRRMVGLWQGGTVVAAPEPEGDYPDCWTRTVLPPRGADLAPSCPNVSWRLLDKLARAARLLCADNPVRLYASAVDFNAPNFARLRCGVPGADAMATLMPMSSVPEADAVPDWARGVGDVGERNAERGMRSAERGGE